MKVIEILIYGLGLLEFPYNDTFDTKWNCHANASVIFEQHKLEYIDELDSSKGLWAPGDYWLGEDGKRYRLAGFRCVDKETDKEIGRPRGY